MKTAMILAAGRGDRLKPLTNLAPKSLCLVGGQPLIVHHIKKLAAANFKKIIINHAWLGGKIRQTLGDGRDFGVDIVYSAEPPGGLETGGGIHQALPFIGNDPFACINADIYTDFDFSQLSLSLSACDTHLILVENPAHNPQGDFGLAGSKLIEKNNRRLTFSGIAVHHPRMFKDTRTGRYSITPILQKTISHGRGCGQQYDGVWVDIGCISRLNYANKLAVSSAYN